MNQMMKKMTSSYQSPPPMWGLKKEKQRNQVKSKFYYIFWGIMAASVLAGQIYVGTGYREMAEATRETKAYWQNTIDRVLPRW